ncbi:MAG: hypothetical protein AB1772_02740 [Candidatus Zixiibacteriota bacterium]
MLGLKDISVSFLTGQPVWVVLGGLALLGLTGLLYWQTNPPLSLRLRIVLGAIRVIAVLTLIAALSEPVIGYARHFERPRRTTILIDRSASMGRLENGLTRAARVDSLLNTDAIRALSASSEITPRYFASGVGERPEGLDQNQTALGSVLQELNQQELARPADYWLLLSDGNSNSGPHPVEVAAGLKTPIIAVGVALSGASADLALDAVDFNAIAFVGCPTELKVKLRWSGAQPGPVSAKLLDSNRVVADNRLQIDQESGLAEVSLRYVPTRPGQVLLNVKIDPLTGETDTHNNARTISVKVLKSRVAVLLACESPDYEVGFLNRFLSQSDRYEINLVVLGSRAGNMAGRFPDQQTELNRYDLVILYDLTPNRLENLHELLRSYLAERGGGLWVFMGHRFASGETPARAGELLPFYPSSRADIVYTPFHGAPVEGQLFHPTVRLGDSRADIRQIWAGLPPFRMIVPCDQTAPGAIVLVTASGTADIDDGLPILGYRRLGPGKIMAAAAAPLWTLGFETLSYGGDREAYAKVVEGTVTWLTVQDDFDPIRVAPEQAVYRRGEPVRFDGYAYDPGYRPIPGVTGTVTLSPSGGGDALETDLLEADEGKLRGEFDNVRPGEYTYQAELMREDQLIKTSQGRLLVESFTAEEYDQQGDPTTLASIAAATGGDYHDFRDFVNAVSALDTRAVTVTEEREIVLWGKLWLLLVFIGTLAIEWGLRKFNHLL